MTGLLVVPSKLSLKNWKGRVQRIWKWYLPICISVPARNFCLRAKVAPTTPLLGARFFKKRPIFPYLFLLCKREETVGKLSKWKWQFIKSCHGAFLLCIISKSAPIKQTVVQSEIVSIFFSLLNHANCSQRTSNII